MTKVDFYILSNEGPDEPLRVACRVAEKAWRQGNRVRVEADGAESLRRLDSLMWTYKQESFLPHEVEGEHGDWQEIEPAPVVLGTAGGPGEPPDVLINLSGVIPISADNCPRIAEIVAGDAQSKQAARERYRRYREKGFDLSSHQI